jgi:hypothetical protein
LTSILTDVDVQHIDLVSTDSGEDTEVMQEMERDVYPLLLKIQDPNAQKVISKLMDIINGMGQKTVSKPLVKQPNQSVKKALQAHPIISETLDANEVKGKKRQEMASALIDIVERRESRKSPTQRDLTRAYIYGIANGNLSMVRRQLGSLGLCPHKIYNTVFVGKNILEILVSKRYLPHVESVINKLFTVKISMVPDFDPLEPSHLGVNPEYARQQAQQKYQNLCKLVSQTTNQDKVKDFYQDLMESMQQQSNHDQRGAAQRGGASHQ